LLLEKDKRDLYVIEQTDCMPEREKYIDDS